MGDGDERDDRGAHVGEEEHEDDDDEDGAFNERLLYVVDAALDEIGLTEYVRRDMHVLRKGLVKVFEGEVEVLGEVDGAGVGLLCHGEEHGRTGSFAADAELGRLIAHLDVSHVGEGDDALAVLLYDARAELLGVVGGSDAADDILIAVLIAYATVGIDVHVACGSHDV